MNSLILKVFRLDRHHMDIRRKHLVIHSAYGYKFDSNTSKLSSKLHVI